MARLDRGGARHAPGGALMAPGAASVGRIGARVRGAVQGVGFRPFVHRLARELGLVGFVRNDGEGVWLEVEGARVTEFFTRLKQEAPPLSRIEHLAWEALPPSGEQSFRVEASQAGPARAARIPPDAGLCEACLSELFDPANRRHLYPFIACCDCGPRFTMTARLPYDRPQTAMAAFPLCPACRTDYEDPAGRRFHAEPTCCADCGPVYSATPAAIWARLAAGEIVAVKGVGGYHLYGDARNPETVARLRARKERSGKPFAVMAANLASVQALAPLGETEAKLLASPARPILLVQARAAPEGLAPGLDTLGVMLPATPLHWLLFWEAAGRPEGRAWRSAAQDTLLLATSANPGGEPLAVEAADAEARLAGIADAVVHHDRAILVRADDPVARVIAGAPVYLRRGRGVTPEPIQLPAEIPPTLAFGAELKAAVCVTRGAEAFLAQHVGDLDDAATRRFHAETARHLCAILDVNPEFAACDLHPDFASTRAAEASGLKLARVQHHHAHALACAAENGVAGPFLALTLDGYGYGPAGEAWGGELLRVEGATFQKLGGLAPLALPGGDRAAQEPWRMAVAVLAALGRSEEARARFAGEPLAAGVLALCENPRTPRTSSCGRWFDAAAGLLGTRETMAYEGQAAMLLEGLAERWGEGLALRDAWRIGADNVLDLLPLLEALSAEANPARGAAQFHATLVAALEAWAVAAVQDTGVRTVAFGGGCFLNHILVRNLGRRLAARGLTVLTAQQLPSNDGGIALGQAWVALRWAPQLMEE